MLAPKQIILLLLCSTSIPGYAFALEQQATKNDSISYNPDRKLQCLYASDNRLMGFFDDGTVSQCEECKLCSETVDALSTTAPVSLYETDGYTMTIYESKDAMDAIGIPMEDEHWIIKNFKEKSRIPDCR